MAHGVPQPRMAEYYGSLWRAAWVWEWV